jgi:hypothetical protein
VGGGTGCWSYIPQINTYRVMHRHLIDQGSAYTLNVNTQFRSITMARVEKPCGLAHFQSSFPKDKATASRITKYHNTTNTVFYGL